MDCVVDVNGTIVDFVSGDAYPGAPAVEVTTAWDTIPPFPAGCPALAAATPDGTGTFRLENASCASPLFPPVLLVTVTGGAAAPRAATATDARLACATSDCGLFEVAVRAPAEELGTTWRTDLAADGMANA